MIQAIRNLSTTIRKGYSAETFNQILSLTSSTIFTLNLYATVLGLFKRLRSDSGIELLV